MLSNENLYFCSKNGFLVKGFSCNILQQKCLLFFIEQIERSIFYMCIFFVFIIGSIINSRFAKSEKKKLKNVKIDDLDKNNL